MSLNHSLIHKTIRSVQTQASRAVTQLGSLSYQVDKALTDKFSPVEQQILIQQPYSLQTVEHFVVW